MANLMIFLPRGPLSQAPNLGVFCRAVANDIVETLARQAGRLGRACKLALLVLAESLVVITGKFDLSLESTFGLAPAIGAMLVLPAANIGSGPSCRHS
jgi:ribose/xylose/arabinose/galactoside ABC-type transport system permease subunit